MITGFVVVIFGFGIMAAVDLLLQCFLGDEE